MRNGSIPPEDFIKIWQTSKGWSDVLEKMPKMKRGSINSRVVSYRKLGIPLKKFPRSVFPLDIARLKRLARKALRAA